MRGLAMDAAHGDEDLMSGLFSARNPCLVNMVVTDSVTRARTSSTISLKAITL